MIAKYDPQNDVILTIRWNHRLQKGLKTRNFTKKNGFIEEMKTGGVDGTRTRDPRRDRPIF